MGWIIYYDLDKSKYEVEYKRFKFVFSSNFYLNKFKKEIDEYISIEKQKLNLKFKFYLESDEFLALTLYKKIEKRGFKAYYNNNPINPTNQKNCFFQEPVFLSILSYK